MHVFLSIMTFHSKAAFFTHKHGAWWVTLTVQVWCCSMTSQLCLSNREPNVKKKQKTTWQHQLTNWKNITLPHFVAMNSRTVTKLSVNSSSFSDPLFWLFRFWQLMSEIEEYINGNTKFVFTPKHCISDQGEKEETELRFNLLAACFTPHHMMAGKHDFVALQCERWRGRRGLTVFHMHWRFSLKKQLIKNDLKCQFELYSVVRFRCLSVDTSLFICGLKFNNIPVEI